MDKTLLVSKESFLEMLSKIIESGVTFQAEEVYPNETHIKITFTGGH